MSFISVDAPTIRASVDNMKNFLSFIYNNESLLKQYGAIKIIPPTEFQTIKKKNRIKIMAASTAQHVTVLNPDDFIYTVDTTSVSDDREPRQTIQINEASFWLSLSHCNNQNHLSSVTKIPGKSFFLKRVHRHDFDIHQLPRRSLLRLCNNDVLRQFVPTLTRTHGSGAIFPLESARQRLLSFNYHHEGGLRYWYIVPSSERTALECVFQQQMNSACLEHGSILIDPLMFDKYKIRYHRLIQQPNEIVILAAGILSQSFTDDATWSEAINFALPSWLEDGHADSSLSCACELKGMCLPEMIDTRLFTRPLVHRYISSNLTVIIEEKPACSKVSLDKKTPMMSEIINYPSVSSRSLDQLSNPIAESSMSNSPPIAEELNDDKYLTPSTNSAASSFLKGANTNVHVTIPRLYANSSGTSNDFYELSLPQDFDEDKMATSTSEPRCLSFQEILDLLATPPSTIKSKECQVEDIIYDQPTFEDSPMSSDERNTSTKKVEHLNSSNRKSRKRSRDSRRTLLIRNMRNAVTKADIQHHFVGCTKITIKQNYLAPYFNYAFVLHRSRSDAANNRKRPIDRVVFGSHSYVEYMHAESQSSSVHETADAWNVVVRQIPLDVTEECLRNVFMGCHSMKYIPARVVYNKKTKFNSDSKNKILYGYAFLYYTNTEEASDIVRNSERYQINDQPLVVSLFDSMKSSWSKRKINHLYHSSKQFQAF